MFRSKAKKDEKIADMASEALSGRDWVESVSVENGHVLVVMQADPGALEIAEARKIEVEGLVQIVPDVAGVKVVMTAERHEHNTPPPPAPTSIPLTPSPRRVQKGAKLSDEALQQGQPPAQAGAPDIPGISRILVVASAKGGVGKSTVAVNLAAAMAKAGMKVGLLDADIYGPSIPTMLSTTDAEPKTNSEGKLLPVEAHGLKTLSIGYLSDPDAPMIWRGPIVMSAITQMLNDTEWGAPDDPLDILIIDTPPGTGDAQLTIAQRVPVTAALIVTTPQEVALADVRRGAAMFAKTAVPVLGIVETMSWFDGPDGARSFIMGEGGGARMAAALGLPLLGQLPMIQAIREGGDAGTPAALSDVAAATLFTTLAREVALAMDALDTKAPPAIIFEET